MLYQEDVLSMEVHALQQTLHWRLATQPSLEDAQSLAGVRGRAAAHIAIAGQSSFFSSAGIIFVDLFASEACQDCESHHLLSDGIVRTIPAGEVPQKRRGEISSVMDTGHSSEKEEVMDTGHSSFAGMMPT
jgi:hypothetical protein